MFQQDLLFIFRHELLLSLCEISNSENTYNTVDLCRGVEGHPKNGDALIIAFTAADGTCISENRCVWEVHRNRQALLISC